MFTPYMKSKKTKAKQVTGAPRLTPKQLEWKQLVDAANHKIAMKWRKR